MVILIVWIYTQRIKIVFWYSFVYMHHAALNINCQYEIHFYAGYISGINE